MRILEKYKKNTSFFWLHPTIQFNGFQITLEKVSKILLKFLKSKNFVKIGIHVKILKVKVLLRKTILLNPKRSLLALAAHSSFNSG